MSSSPRCTSSSSSSSPTFSSSSSSPSSHPIPTDEACHPPRKRIKLSTMTKTSGSLCGALAGTTLGDSASSLPAPKLQTASGDGLEVSPVIRNEDNHHQDDDQSQDTNSNLHGEEDEEDNHGDSQSDSPGQSVKHSSHPLPPVSTAPGWPMDALPLDLFAQIAGNLDFADQCQMRLVNKEFNSHMTEVLFRNMTLSYHPDMIATNSEVNAHVEKFGHHFRRFVVASEVSDFDLLCAPAVSSQTIVTSWWGVYRWPAAHSPPSMYSVLEESCREPSKLAAILGHLKTTNSLALCLDSGLGYLCGTTREPTNYPPVFPQDGNRGPRAWLADGAKTVPDLQKEGESMYMLRKMFIDSGFKSDTQVKEGMRLLRRHEGRNFNNLIIDPSKTSQAPGRGREQVWEPTQQGQNPPLPPPRNLEQLEESQMWMVIQSHLAHRSLIACLSEAMRQTPSFATGLFTLRISRLSSSLVDDMSSHTFWECIPQVHTLFLGVVPDWRHIDTIGQDGSCMQVDRKVAPISALTPVFDLLNDYIAPRANITSVHFEWVCGGEFASEGSQYDRYILPVPFTKSVDELLLPSTEVQSPNLLLLPHVRNLSLKNVWCTPEVFFRSVLSMNRSQLRRLDLESVSLSGQTRLVSDPGETTLVSKVQEIHRTKPEGPSFEIQFHSPPPSWAPLEWDVNYDDELPNTAHIHNLNNLLATLLPINNLVNPFNPNHALNPVNIQTPGNLANILNATNPQAPQSPPPLPVPTVQTHPNVGTWPHFVDFFTPGQTMADFRSTSGKQDPPRPRTHAQLLDMTFKSCGYVFVGDFRVNNNTILPRIAYANLNRMLLLTRPGDRYDHNRDLVRDPLSPHPLFQIPERQGVLGEVVRYLDPDESITLERVFGLKQTWHGVYPEDLVREAYRKHQMPWLAVGAGRFSGTISADHERRLNYVQVVDYGV